MAKRNRAGQAHSLKNVRHPVLVRQNGERLVAQSELDQLEEKRAKAAAQLEEIESEILAYKKKRYDELKKEMEALGLNVPAPAKLSAVGERKITRQRDLSKPCKVCGATGHDARRHRADGKKIVGTPTEEDVPLPI
jgi:DNA repair exonuclease SbcCD ATPase subunit